ncbi:hypothetical protein B0I37DRAFT_411544 [Chaetomium sp. MPI-CAGE-AT-0009]|nr:hypothetical protein B0I37DRAFT_411544 [Chaetomium sp. MPI-CAGE-AT-0009]
MSDTGDDNTMFQSAWSMAAAINISLVSSRSTPDPAALDVDMHDPWHMYRQGAINTAPNSPKLDQLALQIIQAKE